eukprot:4261691-Pleurochrysis_carterae.AAC.1
MLQRSAATRAERGAELRAAGWTEPLPTVSMPAAELFGCWAVAAAVAAASNEAPRAVIAIGDCDPAAAALDAATSPRAQMRSVLRGARGLCAQWLGVSVPREANGDADRLSHPDLLSLVAAEAARAGLEVRVAGIPEECWEVLRRAAHEVAEEEGTEGP